MKKIRALRYIIVAVILVLMPGLTFWLSSDIYSENGPAVISTVKAATKNDFGAGSYVSSLPNNNNKQTIVNEVTKLGVGWAREEYTYSDAMDFAPYDIAYAKLRAANINILGLLTYTPGKSHAQWRNYVTSVVYHFPGVNAWEIMNEADNYLSGQDYVSYLKEAHSIIKGKNPANKVILSGITARVESPNFWNGVGAAGGWGYFDAAGLHVFHNTDPFHDSYNNGTLSQEIQKAIDCLNRNGGGKRLWLTEFGWDANKFGQDNQANWLSQGLPIVHNFGEVEKIFIYRMFDSDSGHGLLTSGFSEKPAFGASKDAIARIIAGQSQTQTQTAPTPVPRTPTPTPPPIIIDKTKSALRLDKIERAPGGPIQYRIVVKVISDEGKLYRSIKPKIILTGGQTTLTDFVLVGDEWWAYVTSSEQNTISAKVTANGQVLGTLDMAFAPVIPLSPSPTIITSPPAVSNQTVGKPNWTFIICYGLGSLAVIGLLVFLYIKRRPKIGKV